MDSRFPDSNSRRKRIRIAAAVGLLLVLVAGGLIYGSARDAIGNLLFDQCFLDESQDRIEWTEKPRLVGDHLVMIGRIQDGSGEGIEDGVQIHDARTEYGDAFWSAFTINAPATEGRQMEALASIWPQDLEKSFERAEGRHIFAEADEYNATPSEFRIRAELPPRIKGEIFVQTDLAIVVWGEDPRSASRPLGAECIR